MIEQLLEQLNEEGIFVRTPAKELLKKMGEEYERNYFNNLTAEDWQRIIQKVAQRLPPDDFLKGMIQAGYSYEDIHEGLNRLEEDSSTSGAQDNSPSSS